MLERAARQGPEKETETSELKTYFNVLLDNRWLIFAVAFVFGLAGVLYALGAKSVYESNMTILVEESSPNAAKNVLSTASSLFEYKRATVSEMELLRSRLVIAPVVDTLRLYINVQPKFFPLVGAAIAHARSGILSQPGLFGFGGFVWGGEKLEVSTFDVPSSLQHRTFTITAKGNNVYRLSDEKNSFGWDGKVGTPLRGKIDGLDLEVRVELLEARPGAQFLLRRLSKQGVVAGIQSGMRIAEQGKQSGIVEVRLQGENPELVHALLQEVAGEYLRQTVARKREDAEKSLAFLDAQLIPLRAQLDQSEAQYSQFHHRHGIVNLADEAKIRVEQAAAAKARRAELQQKKADLLSKYGEEHPILVGINKRLNEMDQAARMDGDAIRAMPEMERDELRITRDIKGKSELYNALSTTAQQLRILAASKASNVRLVDAPTYPDAAVKPNRSLIISAAVMTGLFMGMVAAFVKRSVSAGIDGPRTIDCAG